MITNITKNKIICTNKKILKTSISKAIGLMFSRKINDIGYVFIFSKPLIIDLHMFFVFFPIDVIFLDEDKFVIEMKENFFPFTVYLSKKKAKYFIEFPNHTIKTKKISINDKISF